jgi:shikimate dehydrogenase
MTALYGLIGKQLGHSFSRGFFSEKFHNEHIDAVYENFELAQIDAFTALRTAHPNLRGVNVTIPYKEAIIPYLDALSPNAQAVGAVNCIDFRDGLAVGYNTDVIGFRDALAEVYGAGPGGKALILGTGGAAKAVAHVLHHYFEFDAVHFATRNPQGADQFSYAQLAQSGLQGYRLIVNTTPLGMFPAVDASPDLDIATLDRDCLVFDLIYNPEETQLLAAARAHGCPTQNGLDMLMRQAEASWKIWNGNW